MSAKNKIAFPKDPERRWEPTYYARHWLELEDGGSDRWLYVCQDGRVEDGLGTTFIFISLEPLPSDCEDLWCCDVSVVDTLRTPPEEILAALRSCGQDPEEFFAPGMGDIRVRLGLAEMLHGYGTKSPMQSACGGVRKDRWDTPGEGCHAFRRLRKEAREFAEAELLDSESRDRLLDTKIVNGLGQTAREYAQGTAGLWAALRRIQSDENPTPEQRIILGVYQKAGRTLGAGPVPLDITEG
jgi:hypothetical protein